MTREVRNLLTVSLIGVLLLAGAAWALLGSSGLTTAVSGPNSDATTATWNAESQVSYTKTAGTSFPYIGYTKYAWTGPTPVGLRLSTLNYLDATMYSRQVIYSSSNPNPLWEDCPQNMMNAHGYPVSPRQNIDFTVYYSPYPGEQWVPSTAIVKLKVQTKSTTSAIVASEGTL